MCPRKHWKRQWRHWKDFGARLQGHLMTTSQPTQPDELPPLPDVPPEAYYEAWHAMRTPAAFVDTYNRFITVNDAFSELLEYSASELRGTTWMDHTVEDDVEGDMKSVRDVLDGRVNYYAMLKRYRTKTGREIMRRLIVARYPTAPDREMLMFSVQVVPPHQQSDSERNMSDLTMIADLFGRLTRNNVQNFQIAAEVGTGPGAMNSTDNTQVTYGDRTHGNKSTNSTLLLIVFIISVLLFAITMTVAIAWYAISSRSQESGNVAPGAAAVSNDAG